MTRRRSVHGPVLALVTCLAIAALDAAQSREPLRYTLRFPAPQTNYVEVEAQIPTDGRATLDLMMAVWTPGSYLIREYERNVEAVTASADQRPLTVEKTAKNRWRIVTGGAREVTLTYRVYCHEMTVRSNWVDADFALLNGAATFITLAPSSSAGSAEQPPRIDPRSHDVRLELPPGWKTSVTGLPNAPDGVPHHYVAADYDTLVDSPIVAGNPALHPFTVDGKAHVLVDVGEDGAFDGSRAAQDLQRIVQTQKQFWGSLPYDKYVFFNLLTGAGGGLEHRNSVTMMASRWDSSTRERYLNWLSTASHEYFHLWNVKRLRPIELGPFDYEREVYPRSLWISEGVTDYYADLLLRRGSLSTPDEYLYQLSAAIRALQTTPGRLTQTLESASFDAWIKQYRPDDNTINSTISYYTKGAVLGFLLDARIRAATNDAKSLDDVMTAAFQRYSGARGFTPEQFRQIVAEIGAPALAPWLQHVLQTTEEFDYSPALDWFGLEFRPSRPLLAESPGWLGAHTKVENGQLIVRSVPRGTPAFDAGVNAGDEILGIDDLRIAADQFDQRLESYRPGRKITLLVARRDQIRRLEVTLGPQPSERWILRVKSNSTPEQRAHLTSWLGPLP